MVKAHILVFREGSWAMLNISTKSSEYCFTRMKMVLVGNVPDCRWNEVVYSGIDGPTDPKLRDIWQEWLQVWSELNNQPGHQAGFSLMIRETEIRSRMKMGWT